MTFRHLGFWGLASVPLFVAGIALIAVNLVDGRPAEVALTIGLLTVGAVALLSTSVNHSTQPGDDFSSGQRRMSSGRRSDWLPAGVVAGFAGTTLLTAGLLISYAVARAGGSANPSATFLERWLWSLTHNPVTETAQVNLSLALILHFGAGILLGVLYSGVVEPHLYGPGWRKGVLFSLIPWILSLVLFLPIIGGGFLGLSLQAGPLPILGNLILHLVYGITVGAVYAVERWQTESGEPADDDERRLLDRSQRASAIGVAFGLMCGGLIGQAAAGALGPGQDPLLVAVIAALIGSGMGFMLGSYAGLTPERERE